MKLSVTRRSLAFITVFVVGLGSAVAFAAIPSADGQIRGCYNNANGRLSVIDEGATCGRNETLLTWNQQGPAGPAGPAGPSGTARVYGFVNPNGTLDAELNGGIVGVAHPSDGYYCFDLGGPVKNAVATIDPSTVGFVAVIYTYVPHAGAIGLSGCPTGYNDAAAIVKNASGFLSNAGFYVNFN